MNLKIFAMTSILIVSVLKSTAHAEMEPRAFELCQVAPTQANIIAICQPVTKAQLDPQARGAAEFSHFEIWRYRTGGEQPGLCIKSDVWWLADGTHSGLFSAPEGNVYHTELDANPHRQNLFVLEDAEKIRVQFDRGITQPPSVPARYDWINYDKKKQTLRVYDYDLGGERPLRAAYELACYYPGRNLNGGK